MLANQEVGLIPHSDWVQYQNDIDKWCTELQTKVNQAVNCSCMHTGARQM